MTSPWISPAGSCCWIDGSTAFTPAITASRLAEGTVWMPI